ncbi:hypothetical protein MTO96_029038 [Rhipicephalus appendiculatus]
MASRRAPSCECQRRRPRRPQLDDSPSQIRLWLPEIQREMSICLRKAKDPCQPDDRAAKRTTSPQSEQIQSTRSPAESVTVTYEVDVGSASEEPGSSRMGQVVAPSADLMPDNELDLNWSYSSLSSFENTPSDYILMETDYDMVTARASRPRIDYSLSDD